MPDTPQLGISVNAVVQAKREELGLSKRELARVAGMSSAYVSALESGRLQPSLRAFARLAIELRLSPREIAYVVWAEAGVPQTTAADPLLSVTPG